MKLKVAEIFRSVQGESSYSGLPCGFVRLAGCNLRCRYCDTAYAREGGEEMALDDIVEQITTMGPNLAEITGGEPLLQSETPALAEALLQKGRRVLVETNGTMDISVLPKAVIRIMDIKCPSSGESHQVRWDNLWRLTPEDEVKFVIADRHDYEWAKGILRERFDRRGSKILMSVVFGELLPRNLVQWMLEDGLEARFQIQLHRYIWPQESRGI
jgi:7-carboxy-7-deazaguanine synthase